MLVMVALSAGGLWISRRHHAQRERITLIDPLTGVGNRRQLERMSTRLLRDPSDGRRHAVLVLDLDGFKQVNDRQGHARGDALLRRVAEAMQDAVRPDDHVIRLGGDEFAVLLEDVPPGADAGQAAVDGVLQRVRGLVPDVGISEGGARWPEHADHLSGLLDRADRAMYEDKERRRAAEGRRSLTSSR
jgi:diguanylate cyclase (GGDEF)-like protein